MDRQPLSHVLAQGWRRQIWRKIFLLCRWWGLKDSCLSPSAQRWNGKCKHHYHFQKTAITSFFSGNVDQSRETSPRKDRWSFQLFWQIISVPLLSAWAAVVDVSFIVWNFLTQVRNWECVCTAITDMQLIWNYHMIWSDDSWQTWCDCSERSEMQTCSFLQITTFPV